LKLERDDKKFVHQWILSITQRQKNVMKKKKRVHKISQ